MTIFAYGRLAESGPIIANPFAIGERVARVAAHNPTHYHLGVSTAPVLLGLVARENPVRMPVWRFRTVIDATGNERHAERSGG